MALIKKRLSAKKIIGYGAIIGVIIFTTILVAYLGLFKKPDIGEIQSDEDFQILLSEEDEFYKVSGYDAIADLRNISKYKNLRKFGSWPPQSEPRGNENPFVVKQ